MGTFLVVEVAIVTWVATLQSVICCVYQRCVYQICSHALGLAGTE